MFKFVNKKKSKSFPRPKFAREKFPSADFPTLRTPLAGPGAGPGHFEQLTGHVMTLPRIVLSNNPDWSTGVPTRAICTAPEPYHPRGIDK